MADDDNIPPVAEVTDKVADVVPDPIEETIDAPVPTPEETPAWANDLIHKVQALESKVESLATPTHHEGEHDHGDSDESPERKPWTHRGF